MKNDIFIDTNVAKNFGNPLDDDYKDLITWLLKHNPKDKTPEKDAHLVISQKLFAEYVPLQCIGAASQTNIAALVAQSNAARSFEENFQGRNRSIQVQALFHRRSEAPCSASP